MMYDVIIIGSGAAGLAAGIYAGRYGLKTIVIGEKFGGTTLIAGTIENYPGIKAIGGYELMETMRAQAAGVGVEIKDGRVTKVERLEHCFQIYADGAVFQAIELIIAVGAKRRLLGVPNEPELTGHGVHYCVTCDGPLYRGKTIAMVGGGDAAVKGAVFAAEYAKKVYLITRNKVLSSEAVNLERLQKLSGRIEVIVGTSVQGLVGKGRLEKVELSRPYQGSKSLVVDGLFIEIGATPDAELAIALGVRLNGQGYISVDPHMRTSVHGVYAAGDAVDLFGDFKQDITAAAMGAVAATSAYEDHHIHGNLCSIHVRPPAAG